jgi:hypothetical protein
MSEADPRRSPADPVRVTLRSKSMTGFTAIATSVARISLATVWLRGEPVWAENYYGYILRPDMIDAARAGATIQAALSAMYQEGRFLGEFDWAGPHGHYQDHSSGDVSHFHGREVITVSGVETYALDYCGGLIKP